jgi:hypothetical protein
MQQYVCGQYIWYGFIFHPFVYFALAILLNKNFNKLISLIDPKNDNLFLLVVNDLFLVGKKMLLFIDCMLHMIKQVHNLVYPSNFDVIMT